MFLTAKATYEGELNQIFFNSTIRRVPAKLRRNIRNLEFRVSPNTYLDYIELIASRQGALADQYLAGIVGNPTYGGVPIVADPEVNDMTIEIYNPMESGRFFLLHYKKE